MSLRDFIERAQAIGEEGRKDPLPDGARCGGVNGKQFCLHTARVIRDSKIMCAAHAIQWEARYASR